MASLADLSEFVNRCTGGNSGTPESLFMHKEPRVAGAASAATVAGHYSSLWQYEGNPSHGAVPTTVAVPDNTTAGGWKQANPGGGRQKWNPAVGGYSSGLGTLYLYDRILHIGGLDGTVTTNQTVAGSTTRYTNGLGVEIWVEIYTQIGASSTTITASYTNQAGSSGQTGQATVIGNTGFREAQRIIPLSLAAGDNGVQACASVKLNATTGTAGNFGVTLARRLAAITIGAAGFGSVRTFVDGPMNEILTNACLAWVFFANTAQSPSFDMTMFNLER